MMPALISQIMLPGLGKKIKALLEAAGFTENDYWCMEHQTFADPEFFNSERMELLEVYA